MIGKTVAHYEITEKLGRGGMGVVYKAFDTRLRRHVALKFLPAELSADPAAKARFVQEARAAAALEHASICTIHEIGETGETAELEESRLYIAMAFYEGETLERRLKQGAIPHDEALRIAARIAEGLGAAHAEGIVHRDIKPANVMLTAKGEVKILDFGIAKLGGQTLHTREGSTLGTTAYMSPEQARGEPVDGRSDLWSLGVILYEMLAGRRPFAGDYEQAVVYAILNEKPETLVGEDANLAAIVERLLTKPAACRYGDAEALLDDLRRLDAGEKIAVRGRRRRRAWSVAALAVAVVVAGSFWLGRDGSPAGGDGETAEAATADAERIAVLPFTYHGDEAHAWLGNGLQSLMSTNLGGTKIGGTVPESTVRYAMDRLDSTSTLPVGEGVARYLKIARYVQGEIVAVGDGLRISAELHDLRAAGSEPLRGNVAGSLDELYDLVDELGGQLLVGLTYESGRRDAALALGTVDLEALKAFLDGMQLSRIDDDRRTREAFLEAVEADSTFSLAWFWLSYYQPSRPTKRAAVLRAMEYAGDLPERDHQMMAARLAVLDAEYDRAEQIYRDIVRKDPQDIYALLDLENLLWSHAPARGRSPLEAIPITRRVLELGPDFRNWMPFHMTVFAIVTSDLDFLARHPPCPFYANLCSLSKIVQAFDQSYESAVAVLDDPYWGGDERMSKWWTTKEVDWIRTDPFLTLEMARRMVTPDNSVDVRFQGRLLCSQFLTARGRFGAATAHLDSMQAIDDEWGAEYPGFVPAYALEMLAYCTAAPFVDPEPGLADSLRSALEGWAVDDAAAVRAPWPPNLGCHRFIRLYLLGLLEIRSSRHDAALQRAEELERLAANHERGPRALSVAASLRARVAFARGDRDEALALLETLPRNYEHGDGYSTFFTLVAEHHLRGEILFSLGRYDEALTAFEGTRSFALYLFNAVRFYHQARCHEAMGNHEDAAADYREFLQLWQAHEPEQARLFDDAQRRLAALTARG